jgi:hypothetical protein
MLNERVVRHGTARIAFAGRLWSRQAHAKWAIATPHRFPRQTVAFDHSGAARGLEDHYQKTNRRSGVLPLASRRDDSLYGNDVIDADERAHDRERLTGAGWRDHATVHPAPVGAATVDLFAVRPLCEERIGRFFRFSVFARAFHLVRVRRHLVDIQRDLTLTSSLAKLDRFQSRTCTGVHRGSAAKVRQCECRPSVTAVDGSENREQLLMLTDRHKLAIALGVAAGREIPREYFDLS